MHRFYWIWLRFIIITTHFSNGLLIIIRRKFSVLRARWILLPSIVQWNCCSFAPCFYSTMVFPSLVACLSRPCSSGRIRSHGESSCACTSALSNATTHANRLVCRSALHRGGSLHTELSFVQCRSWLSPGRLMRYRRQRTGACASFPASAPSARLARASWSARGFLPTHLPSFLRCPIGQ